MHRAEEKARDFEGTVNATELKVTRAEATLLEREQEKKAVQGELDDLLMVFGDLEDKVKQYKRRLRALGEDVSDGEDEDDVEDDADGHEEDGVD